MTKLPLLAIMLTSATLPLPAAALVFDTGDLVVSVEGKGDTAYTDATGAPITYADNAAAPLSLFEYTTAGTKVGSMALSQTTAGNQYAVSGEYGSSSEGILQLSGNGQYLTIMGYGVNANDFNANPTAYGTLTTDPTKPTALGQSGSLTGQAYTAVARVVAEISATGSVDSSTALYNVYNGNNPRSVFTVDGKSFYTSGQGLGGKTDNTGGVFFAALGSHSATSVTGNDAGGGFSQDTRDVQVVNGIITVSSDSKSGSTTRDYVGTLGAAGGTTPANGGNGPTMLSGFGNSKGTGKLTLSAGQTNTLNMAGQEINLSPESFFYANASTLYVADSGNPKSDSVVGDTGASRLGDGGLQKWSLVGNSWVLDYTLSAGLNLVANPNAAAANISGTTGLLSLTGKVLDNGLVELFATNFTIGDTDQTYLYGITDTLSATTLPNGESFTQLAAAPADSNFKGVAFAPSAAPVPEPASWAMMLAGFGLLGLNARRRQRSTVAAV